MYNRTFENSKNREKTITRLNDEIACVQKLLEPQYCEVVGVSRQDELRNILKKLNSFKKKLQNNTFEISIVGLEKSGKSTFANAFMGNDILPTKDARCTYTATSIQYGTNNEAMVKFYSDTQFNEEFHRKLALLGIVDSHHWTEWTEALLDEEMEKLPLLRSEHKNIGNDVAEILHHKTSIMSLLGKDILCFTGDELEYEIKGYIENPAQALAVKEIIISSEKLSAMRNAVIYDVPGFDSPTQLHKDQTRSWMKKSDAVILIVNADRPSFNDSLVQFFESVDKDDDGIAIGEKLFVFANRADVAATLQENLQRIRGELEHYCIMPTQLISHRLIAGSAKARIELDRGNAESSIVQSLKEKGLDGDGIDIIRSQLEEYNNTVRLEVMQHRILHLKKQVLELFNEIRYENQLQEGAGLELQMENLVDDLKSKARKCIHDALAECSSDAVDQCRKNKPITNKVRQNVIQTIDPDRYRITEEELRRAQNAELSGAGVLERFDASIRDNKFTVMYNEFIDSVVHLAVEEYNETDKKILSAFENGFDLTPSHPFYAEMKDSLKRYIADQCGNIAPQGYYNSLIRRYSRNLFEILISTPFGNNARYRKFDEERRNFYSLSLFSNDNDIRVRPDTQSMHYQILFHQKQNKDDVLTNELLNHAILMTEDATHEVVAVNSTLYQYLKQFCNKYLNESQLELERILAQLPSPDTTDGIDIPMFAVRENPSVTKLIKLLKEKVESESEETISCLTEHQYNQFFRNYKKKLEDIPVEFCEDVCILKNILNEQVMNAVSIEIPFLDLVKQNIISLQESLETSEFTSFINKEKSRILEEKYNRLNEENERRKRRLEIIHEIDGILGIQE